MHQPGNPIVLVNVWDAASARVVAAHPHTRAIASGSWSVAAANGHEDGGGLPLEAALAAALRIVTATDLPVSIDFESGYADTPKGVFHNVRHLIETGAVGLNIEDSRPMDTGGVWDASEAASRVAAVRAAAVESGIPLVINARTDTLIHGGTVDDAIARGNAYLEAGADCVFVLGVDGSTTDRVVTGLNGPLSVMAGAGSPSIAEFAAAGVARVSFGPGPMGVAYAALDRLVGDVHAGQPHSPELAFRPGST
jgi:2-methylisocitrate lyase-like PEP mutase family enzyme